MRILRPFVKLAASYAICDVDVNIFQHHYYVRFLRKFPYVDPGLGCLDIAAKTRRYDAFEVIARQLYRIPDSFTTYGISGGLVHLREWRDAAACGLFRSAMVKLITSN